MYGGSLNLSRTITDKYGEIATIISDFFNEDASRNVVLDLAQCYETLGTIKDIIYNGSEETKNE